MIEPRSWTASALVILTWGVLALGATKPWGYLPLFLAMTAYGGAAFFRRGTPSSIDGGLHLSLSAVCGAVFFQLIPLPDSVLTLISPAAAALHDRVGMRVFDDAAGNRWRQSHPLSVDPSATALGLASVVALALFFVGTVRTMRSVGTRRLAVGIIALGTIVALVGIAEGIGIWPGIYSASGLPMPPDSTPYGPFSSTNHYVAWMLMALTVTLGCLCAVLEQVASERDRDASVESRGSRALFVRLLLLQSAATLMAVALVQTKSRAAMLCLAVALLTMGGLLLRRRMASGRNWGVIVGSLLFLPLAGVAVTGAQPIVERFVTSSWKTAHGRLPIWWQATAIARDFPITGSGLNTYQSVVSMYPSPNVHGSYEGAHNDYLQLAAEGGLLVGLPVLSTMAFLAREIRRRLRTPNDCMTLWLRVGAVVGLVLLAAHATVDFGLQVPGTAALFTMLAAIAISPTTTTQP